MTTADSDSPPPQQVRSARFGLGRVLIDNGATFVVRFAHGIEECEATALEVVAAPHQALDRDQWDVPLEVINRLHAETAKGMRTPETRDMLGKQGFDVVAGSPAEFSAWIRTEQAKWSKVIRASGAVAD